MEWDGPTLTGLARWLPIDFDWLPKVFAMRGRDFIVPVPLLTRIVLDFLYFTIIHPPDRLGTAVTDRVLKSAMRCWGCWSLWSFACPWN